MKILLILMSMIALSHAGIGIADEAVEKEALRLWDKYCANSKSNNDPEITGDGKTYVHCKQADDTPIQIPVEHTTELSNENNDTITIFIRPPVYEYQHNVTLTGETSLPKTVVYVKSVAHNHTLKINDRRRPGATEKPTIYYLKGLHTANGGSTANALSVALNNAQENVPTTTPTTSATPTTTSSPGYPLQLALHPSYYSHNGREVQDAAPSFNKPNIYWSPQYVANRYVPGGPYQRNFQ